MSIKEQVEFAKEELTQDEKLLAGMIKAERFYKRNRVMIIALTVIVIFGGLGYLLMDYFKEQRLLEANQAYLRLQANPSDLQARKILETKNPELARLYEVKEAIAAGNTAKLKKLQQSQDPIVADMAAYHDAAFEKDGKKLGDYRLKTEALLKDFAILDGAYLAMSHGDIKKGKTLLDAIKENSPLAPIAQMMRHYGIVSIKGNE